MCGVRYLRAAALTALILILPVLLLRAQTPGSGNNAYVDAQLCARCHPKIARTYALTGMARSFYRVQPQNAEEDFTRGNPFYHQLSATWYAMLKRDGTYYQRRWRIGNSGREIHVQESRIDYVMGSGNHARTYLQRTGRGRCWNFRWGGIRKTAA